MNVATVTFDTRKLIRGMTRILELGGVADVKNEILQSQKIHDALVKRGLIKSDNVDQALIKDVNPKDNGAVK